MRARTLKKKNDIVVAATDFSECANFATEHAIGVAKTFNYNLHILHIKNKKLKMTDDEIHQILGDQVKELRNEGLEARYAVRGGNITHAIGEYVEEVKGNYLTIGTRGKTGVEYVFGNYAAKIIENSPVPTIVVQKRHFNENSYKNIIMPIDDGIETRQKVKWAILFAKKWDSNIHIFAKHSTDSYYAKKIKTNVLQVKKVFDQNSIHYTIHFSKDRKTNFGRQLTEYAIGKKGDLIIIMTDLMSLSPGMFTGGLFGGHSEDIEQLINDASQIPYLCVNPQDLGKKRGLFSLFSASGG